MTTGYRGLNAVPLCVHFGRILSVFLIRWHVWCWWFACIKGAHRHCARIAVWCVFGSTGNGREAFLLNISEREPQMIFLPSWLSLSCSFSISCLCWHDISILSGRPHIRTFSFFQTKFLWMKSLSLSLSLSFSLSMVCCVPEWAVQTCVAIRSRLFGILVQFCWRMRWRINQLQERTAINPIVGYRVRSVAACCSFWWDSLVAKWCEIAEKTLPFSAWQNCQMNTTYYRRSGWTCSRSLTVKFRHKLHSLCTGLSFPFGTFNSWLILMKQCLLFLVHF